MISIITPTYNREKELVRLYKSLISQTNLNFEWILVDDGSNDNTALFVKNIVAEKKIRFSYIFKENGGKPSAYNTGVINAKGSLLFCLDSDDFLDRNAIETISNDYLIISSNSEIAGIVYDRYDYKKTKSVIGSRLPDGIIDTYYNIYTKYKVKGDKLAILKSEIAKKYLLPLIPNEKFITEAIMFNRLSKYYKFLYKNDKTSYVEYKSDGYSANYFSLVKKNPLGNAMYFNELYLLDKSLYNIYGYLLFSIYAKKPFFKYSKKP